jgi:hypothetical protein
MCHLQVLVLYESTFVGLQALACYFPNGCGMAHGKPMGL